MRIRENTLQKVDQLFTRSRVDSEKALLTSRGGVYSSRSVAGRFLRLLRIAKPVELNEFRAHLNSRLSPGQRRPIIRSPHAGRTYLSAGSFRQLLETTVRPHNASTRANFQAAISGLQADSAKAEDTLIRYNIAKVLGTDNVAALRAELDSLAGKLDQHIGQISESRNFILANADEQLEVPENFGDLVSHARVLQALSGEERGEPPHEYGRQLEDAGFSLPDSVHDHARFLDAANRLKYRCHTAAESKARPWMNPEVRGALNALRIDPKTASELSMKDIRSAYRKLSLEVHPDKVAARAKAAEIPENLAEEAVQQATEQFNQVKQAYDLLQASGYLFSPSPTN